jgi:hypothetical protein
MSRRKAQASSALPALTGEPDHDVIDCLRMLRSRAIWVMAVRYAVVAVAIGVVIAEGTALAVGTSARATLVLVSGGALGALCVATLWAVWRAPTLIETAQLADRRLGWQNHASAALQFAGATDAVARLVVRDGAARLARSRPAEVFPFEYPARLPWLLAGVLAATSLLLGGYVRATMGDGAQAPSGSAATGGAGQRGSPAANAAGVADPAPGAAGPSAAGASAAQPPGAVAPAATAGAKGAASPAADASAHGSQAADTPVRHEGGTGPANASVPTAASPSTAADAGSASAVTAGPLSPAGGVSATTASGAAAGDGAGTVDSTTALGGGVRGGTLAPDATRKQDNRPAFTARERALYRGEWDRAQAAVAQDRIPPALRPYVRAYFEAIRSAGQR